MRKKVMMLGWEFPPVINGGLGVACLGLAKAMRQHVDLSIILPKSDPNYVVEQVELIGLNNLTLQEIHDYQAYTTAYSIFEDVTFIQAEISAYGSDPQRVTTPEKNVSISSKTDVKTTQLKQDLALFEFGDLYGNDLIDRVRQYAHYVVQVAKDKEFDVIWAHDWMTYLAGVELKKATGKPLVIHVHATTYDRGGEQARGWVYDIEKYGMLNADAILPVSEYTGKVCVEHFGADSSKITPIHNGVEWVDTFKEKKSFPETLVLFLGRITGQKGPEKFLEIADQVIQKNKKVRFVMAGSGDQLKRIIETGAFKHIGDKFHFTGFLNKQKVNRLLAMTDIYCMPSVSEPFGLSALEAAQFGIPVIISKQSGAAEVMSGALKTDFWDVDLTAQYILDLMEDKEFAGRVVEAGFNDLKNLTWENAASKIMQVFNELTP